MSTNQISTWLDYHDSIMNRSELYYSDPALLPFDYVRDKFKNKIEYDIIRSATIDYYETRSKLTTQQLIEDFLSTSSYKSLTKIKSCSICGKTGHNRRTCKRSTEVENEQGSNK